MIRIFTPLAVVALIMLVATLAVGLSIGDYPDLMRQAYRVQQSGDTVRIQAFQAEHRPATTYLNTHRLMGIGSAILVMLVNSLAITYMIGTSRWCKEVGLTYGVPEEWMEEAQINKRKSFPWGVLSMLSLVGLAALGALSDPLRNDPRAGSFPSETWIVWHYTAALLSIGWVGLCFFIQGSYLRAQGALIGLFMDHVAMIRADQGLE
ncbi:MAG: hypothetical protein SFX18_00610 [Pirellulales bacterium]|nr:hypothetical protein [Pirellulales bacterium]